MESLLMPIVDFETLGRQIKEEDFSCLSMDSPTDDISHSSPLGLEADLPAIDAESTNSPIDAPSTPTASILDDDAPSHTNTPTPKRKRGGGTKRKQVKRACSNCRKAHAGCDENRPCRRCVGGGKENTCKDVPRKKRSRSRTDTKDKPSYKKDKKSASILDGIESDELNHNIASAIEQNSRKRKRSNSSHHHHHDSENSCSSDCQSSQGESDHNCDPEPHQHTEIKIQSKKRRNLSQSTTLKRDKSFPANPLSSSTSSIFSHSKIKSEDTDFNDSSISSDLIKSEADFNEGDNTEEESIFDSDLQSSSKQLVFSTFTNYGNILNSNTNSNLSNPNSLQSNPLQTNNNATNTNWNINYGWNDGTTMENKLQDLLGEVKYSLNYQQHSLSIHPTENGYGIEGIPSEEADGMNPVIGSIVGGNGNGIGIGGIQEEEIGKSLDINTFFEGVGTEYLGEGDENGFIYGWEEILNNS